MSVVIHSGSVGLEGELELAPGASGLVLFAHGSGSSRSSPRNRLVAESLRQRGLGTLLFDLLTAEEESADAVDAHIRFDIPLLVDRLLAATDWARDRGLPIGYFGASTGAAAALIAAAERPREVRAVVSRGGRADLAGNWLEYVVAPTLLIVGGADTAVLNLNREALERIPAPRQLVTVPGATHLFEEPGAIQEVARLAGRWFEDNLATAPETNVGAR